MTTISINKTLGVGLNAASYSNPVVIDTGVTISNSDAAAVAATTGSWTVQNAGDIAVTGTYGAGVYLASGGSVTNAASASITGVSSGVKIQANAGTVMNDGSIAGAGATGVGVDLVERGLVTNAASASITGGYLGVLVSFGAGTVVNDGSIAGAGTNGVGVYLHSIGSVTNGASGSIAGDYIGVHVNNNAGIVVNYGSIAAMGASGSGVLLFAGGSVTNASAASITGGNVGVYISDGAAAVVNDGNIAGTGTAADGVDLGVGGSVTNAASASIVGVADGVLISVGRGTLINGGSIAATGISGIGAALNSGGSVSNAASASIRGGNVGVYVGGGAGTVVNDGGIAAYNLAGGTGVYLNDGGSVTNAASASIIGAFDGIHIGGAGTVINDGRIVSTSYEGVDLSSTSSVTNSASGSIRGPGGVRLFAGGTLKNAGAITGSGGTAVVFGGFGNNLLVLDPHYGLSGLVAGSTSASNTLELASAASGGVVGGLGTKFTNFGPIVFDPGAEWSINGNTAGLAGAISGFARGDAIEVTGVTEQTSSFSGGILTLHEAVGSATLDLPGSFTSATDFHVNPNADGTEVTVACFRAGARILTISGEVAVEELRIGDRVVTVRGCRLARVIWLGHRYLDFLRHPRPDDVRPICIKAGAIASGVPHRDLWLSPEHAVLLRIGAETVLVPIRLLVNGTTIAQVPVPSVTYWHVELASHDAIVAEGLPAETYLDTGNRADFANGGAAVCVHPQFADGIWRANACAPQLRYGDALAGLQYRLAIRAAKSIGAQHQQHQAG